MDDNFDNSESEKLILNKEIEAVKDNSEAKPSKKVKVVKDNSEAKPSKKVEAVKDNSEAKPSKKVKAVKDNGEAKPSKKVKVVKDNSEEVPTKEVEVVKDNNEEVPTKEVEVVKDNSEEVPTKEVEVVKDNSEEVPTKEVEVVKDNSEEVPTKEVKVVAQKSIAKSIEKKELYPTVAEKPKSKKKIRMIIVAAVIIFLMTSALVSGIFIGNNIGISKDMPLLIEAYGLLKDYYYKDISWSEFQEYATASFLGSVDNFTGMYQISSTASRKAMGISIGSTVYNEHPITFITPGSAGSRAKAVNYYNGQGVREDIVQNYYGLNIGDRIYAISIDGNPFIRVENLPISGLSTMIQNSESMHIGLQVIRNFQEGETRNPENIGKPIAGLFEYYIDMEDLQSKNAYYCSADEIGSQNAGYIKLLSFSDNACFDFMMCADAFLTDAKKPNKLILDLRGNGGGDSHILGFISKYLIKNDTADELPIIKFDSTKKGKIKSELISTQSTYATAENGTINAKYLGSFVENFEVVVLCDGGTASSSEALIGALQFYNNSEIVGSTTYGKGVGQMTFSIGDGKYKIAITNGYYYIPTLDKDGATVWTENIHGKGFTPKEINTINAMPAPLSRDMYLKRALELLVVPVA